MVNIGKKLVEKLPNIEVQPDLDLYHPLSSHIHVASMWLSLNPPEASKRCWNPIMISRLDQDITMEYHLIMEYYGIMEDTLW